MTKDEEREDEDLSLGHRTGLPEWEAKREARRQLIADTLERSKRERAETSD